MIGKKISPILEEIEATLLEFEAFNGDKPNYTDDGFRAAVRIFSSALVDKMFELQSDEKMDMQDCLNMAEKVGEDVRKLIKTYTNIDTHDFYKEKT